MRLRDRAQEPPKQVMDRYVFVIRNKEGLTRAAKEIDEIERDIARIQVPRFVRCNLEWTRAVEFPFVVRRALSCPFGPCAGREQRIPLSF
jgi:succinate dehydrogenase/fumarate reductase flavoprotein subunit